MSNWHTKLSVSGNEEPGLNHKSFLTIKDMRCYVEKEVGKGNKVYILHPGSLSWSDSAEYDEVDNLAEKFSLEPLTVKLLVNSVPKCGTHLLRNILRMFIPVNQVYREFLGDWDKIMLENHINNGRPGMSTGHVNFDPGTAVTLKSCKHVVLVRDPYDYALAYARFLKSNRLDVPIARFVRANDLNREQIMSIVIFGSYGELYQASLKDVFTRNAISWLGQDIRLVRYEDIVHYSQELYSAPARAFFDELLNDCGLLARPPDWIKRIAVGCQRAYSVTDRSNIGVNDPTFAAPPSKQERKLIDFSAPGLRHILGYASLDKV